MADRPLWVCDPPGRAVPWIGELAQTLADTRPDLPLLYTATAPPNGDPPLIYEPPVSDTRAFLARHRPAAAVFFASSLPVAALSETLRGHVPVMLICDAIPPRASRGLLRRLAAFCPVGEENAQFLRRFGLPEARTEPCPIPGPSPTPPPCNEAERADLARLLAGRPIWLAAATTAKEDNIAVEAHSQATRLSHRLLLVLVPNAPERGPELAATLAGQGWRVALRSFDEAPDEDTQIYIADTCEELGLWMRLAPVTFLGGSLDRDGPGSIDPAGPAALGSAILHGTHAGAHAELTARLVAARATGVVYDATGLGRMLYTLSAPDRAAELAHNAWRVSSEGAEATQIIAARLLGLLGPEGAG